MTVLSEQAKAQIVLTLEYGDGDLQCREHYFCGSVNLWRDCFTWEQQQKLTGLQAGDSCTLASGVIMPANPSLVYWVARNQWQPPARKQADEPYFEPRRLRWYPQGFLRGVANIYSETLTPMRVLALEEKRILVDCNHPLAGWDVHVAAEVLAVEPPGKERGGRCADWLEEAMAAGPGMQLQPLESGNSDPWPDFSERFLLKDSRMDTLGDGLFYRTPRLVDHIDTTARTHLLGCTARLLQPGNSGVRVLDLMSSLQSHFPLEGGAPANGAMVTGLGMNRQELEANPALSHWLLQDLNEQAELRFADGSFELVVCHLSVEYLLQPEKVVAEVARVLAPGGKCLISFSNRWFPEKVTGLWQHLHEYERVRYVLSLLQNHFHEFRLETFRNWPRPEDDPHSLELAKSDPLYVVTCEVR